MAVKIRFTKARKAVTPSKKNQRNTDLLLKLETYLNQKEPEIMKFLSRGLGELPNVVTYKELREAYLSGGITQSSFNDWQIRYSKLIDSVFRAEWYDVAFQAALEEKKKYPFIYDPARSEALKWLNNHAAELVTNLAQEQMDALNAIVYHFSGYESASPDEVARQMRAVIGLTRPQAIANARYYESVKTAWLKENPKGRMSTAEKYAREAAAKYAGKQHRYRAKCIARTELAFGYNAGLYGAAKDAQAQGYIGDCKKRWVTAHDGPPNRVCPECEKLDGVMVGMDDYFSNNALIPPGHSQCRCVVDFVETPALITPPPVDNGSVDGIIVSGAVSGALDPISNEAEKHAKVYYQSVRKMKTDYKRIAKNTGYTEEQVREIKNFIFLEKHDLGNGKFDYFHPSYEMGQSWQRLIDGKNIQPHDWILLKHEIMERELMSKGLTQGEAHIETSKVYDYKKESDKYYAELGKHKKKQ